MVARAGALRAARVVHSLWTERLPGGGRLGTDRCPARSSPVEDSYLTSVVDPLAQQLQARSSKE